MEDGLLSLKWNNHKITFCEILRTLREKSNYTDATIAVEGKFYPVHKLVLSTCSEYFEDIFARTPCKSPVIVLKDVRSQDMDALLDYMYLGEVNVNQNDLASLLKTAECLRIKGLAVPDEDTSKSRKAPSDERQDTPPPKRRRHEDASRPVSPPVSGNTKTPTPSASPIQPPPPLGSHSSPARSDSDPPPQIVKVEMQEQDHEDSFRKDSYEGSVNEEGGGDFGTDVTKSEHNPETYGSSSFPGPSLQPGGDLAWEEGDSSSFPPESFSGDVSAGQPPQGDVTGMMCGQLMQIMEKVEESIPELPLADNSTPQMPSGIDYGMFGLTQPMLGAPPLPNPVDDVGGIPCAAGPPPGTKQPVRYLCAVCPKGFRSKADVERHMRTHTGEKPFICPHCTHRSATKGNLKAHMKHIHADIESEAFTTVQ